MSTLNFRDTYSHTYLRRQRKGTGNCHYKSKDSMTLPWTNDANPLRNLAMSILLILKLNVLHRLTFSIVIENTSPYTCSLSLFSHFV